MGQDYRERCLEAKGEFCQICDDEKEIVVHHIDGDRENNDLDNLMPVCKSCHQRIHGGSAGYEEWYEKLDSKRDIAFLQREAEQRPFYARPEAWQKYHYVIDFEVKRELHEMGYRDVQERELYEAMLRLGADNPLLVADELVELRRES